MSILWIAPLLTVLGALPASAQGGRPAPEHHDECIVGYVEDLDRAASDSAIEPLTLGTFLTDAQGEGSVVLKRLALPQSSLFAFVSVFYEDDLLYAQQLDNAITFSLMVTASQSEVPDENDGIAASTTQIPMKHFRVWEATLAFKNKEKPQASSCDVRSIVSRTGRLGDAASKARIRHLG